MDIGCLSKAAYKFRQEIHVDERENDSPSHQNEFPNNIVYCNNIASRSAYACTDLVIVIERVVSSTHYPIANSHATM